MFLLIRELVGWSLVAFALVMARIALTYVENRQVVEGMIIVLILLASLKAGILLIRISIAARIAAKQQ